MAVFGIVFVLINLAVPYWVWNRKSNDSIDRSKIESTVMSIVDATGGFPPCDRRDVASVVSDLCEKSMRKLSGEESTILERAAVGVVFACEARKDELRITFTPEQSPNHDLTCSSARADLLALGPSYHANLKGQLRRIEFSNSQGQRDQVDFTECRRKLKVAMQLAPPPASESEFLMDLESHNNLPTNKAGELITRNRVCMNLDPSPLWAPFRKRYGR